MQPEIVLDLFSLFILLISLMIIADDQVHNCKLRNNMAYSICIATHTKNALHFLIDIQRQKDEFIQSRFLHLFSLLDKSLTLLHLIYIPMFLTTIFSSFRIAAAGQIVVVSPYMRQKRNKFESTTFVLCSNVSSIIIAVKTYWGYLICKTYLL